MATVSTPGLCSASVALLQADDDVSAADDVAAAVEVPVAAGAAVVAPAELLELEFELPQAATSTAARAGNRTADRRRAQSKAHNLHLPLRA